MTVKGLPFFAAGTVVKGFGRGSKELGIPTANFPESVVERLPASVCTGVYFGYARVDQGPIHNMVMSIGWNPFYKNDKKSMETHILHKFDQDFYGSTLRVCMVGFVRPEKNFASLEALVQAIHEDIDAARERCGLPENVEFSRDAFFSQPAEVSDAKSDRQDAASVSGVVRADDQSTQ